MDNSDQRTGKSGWEIWSPVISWVKEFIRPGNIIAVVALSFFPLGLVGFFKTGSAVRFQADPDSEIKKDQRFQAPANVVAIGKDGEEYDTHFEAFVAVPINLEGDDNSELAIVYPIQDLNNPAALQLQVSIISDDSWILHKRNFKETKLCIIDEPIRQIIATEGANAQGLTIARSRLLYVCGKPYLSFVITTVWAAEGLVMVPLSDWSDVKESKQVGYSWMVNRGGYSKVDTIGGIIVAVVNSNWPRLDWFNEQIPIPKGILTTDLKKMNGGYLSKYDTFDDQKKFFKDHCIDYRLCVDPELILKFGVHSGDKLYVDDLAENTVAMIDIYGLIKPLNLGDATRAMHDNEFVLKQNQKQIDAWLRTCGGWPQRWQDEFEAKRKLYVEDPGGRYAWFDAIWMAFEYTIDVAKSEGIQLMRGPLETLPSKK